MNKHLFFFIGLVFLFITGHTQNAPISTLGTRTACQGGTAVVPLTVTGFTAIGAISLRMDYNPTLMTYSDTANINSALSGIMINDVHVSANLHRVMAIWSSLTPLTLASGAKLFDIKFTYITGTPSFSFNTISNGGSDCEFTDVIGNVLNDEPAEMMLW